MSLSWPSSSEKVVTLRKVRTLRIRTVSAGMTDATNSLRAMGRLLSRSLKGALSLRGYRSLHRCPCATSLPDPWRTPARMIAGTNPPVHRGERLIVPDHSFLYSLRLERFRTVRLCDLARILAVSCAGDGEPRVVSEVEKETVRRRSKLDGSAMAREACGLLRLGCNEDLGEQDRRIARHALGLRTRRMQWTM